MVTTVRETTIGHSIMPSRKKRSGNLSSPRRKNTTMRKITETKLVKLVKKRLLPKKEVALTTMMRKSEASIPYSTLLAFLPGHGIIASSISEKKTSQRLEWARQLFTHAAIQKKATLLFKAIERHKVLFTAY